MYLEICMIKVILFFFQVHIPDPVNYITSKSAESEADEVAPWSKEFVDILEAVQQSEYYTSEAEEACVIIPPVDVLNEDGLADAEAAGKALSGYPGWNGGENNLVFNMLPAARGDSSLSVAHGKAMVAGAGIDDATYRSGFDISLPTFSPFVQLKPALQKEIKRRRWTLLSSQINARPDLKTIVDGFLRKEKDVLVLSKCPAPLGSKDEDVRCADLSGAGPQPYSYTQVSFLAKPSLEQSQR